MGRIPKAIEYSGISRSGLYELAAKWPGLFRKNGVSTGASTASAGAVLSNCILKSSTACVRIPRCGCRHDRQFRTDLRRGRRKGKEEERDASAEARQTCGTANLPER